jgi:ABC-type nickel/cobalt efflux system permease component RcnA
LDADHLIAVSAIVGESKELSGSSAIGVLWGLGHTASLLLVGVAVIALQIEIPERIALAMEFGVAAMLIGLGVRVVWKLMRGGTLHVHVHSHENHGHAHPHVHPPGEEHILDHRHTHHSTSFAPLRPAWWQSQARTGKRSIFIGMVHGLAGSAPLMLIVLTTIPSPSLALSYIGMFGLGSVGGMLVMSTLIGLPFAFTARRSRYMNIVIRALSGALSIAFGVFIAWQIGFVEGLFL